MKYELPIIPAYLSTNYSKQNNQHEVFVEAITSTSWVKILDPNKLCKEKLAMINFYIEDKNKIKFNNSTLDKLIDPLTHESMEFHCEPLYHNKSTIEAIPPLNFIVSSEVFDLESFSFQIAWKNTKK